MAEENALKVEKLEKSHQEMKESMMEMKEMMESMNNMMKNMTKGKSSGENADTPKMAIPQGAKKEEPTFPMVYTYTQGQTSQGACPTMYPQSGGFPVPYPTAPMFPTTNVGQQVGANMMDAMTVPDLDDPNEQEKLLMKDNLEQADNEAQLKFDLIEERLRAVEGEDMYGMVDMNRMSLVPDLVLPPKFKMLEFEKYNGTKCPSAHLFMFCRKMAGYTNNEKLLIHYFQESLSGSATRWYNQLDRNNIRSWRDLGKAFLTQYKHMTDSAPDRMSLQNMENKPYETFREYAHRWRDLASQIQPPMTEKETAKFFINTLKDPYYDRMIGNPTKIFADIVTAGEMIESAIKAGKIQNVDMRKGPFNKKKEGETNAVTYQAQPYVYQQNQGYQSYSPAANTGAQGSH